MVEFFNATLAYSSLEEPRSHAFIFDLWTLFQKHGYVDSEKAVSSLQIVIFFNGELLFISEIVISDFTKLCFSTEKIMKIK